MRSQRKTPLLSRRGSSEAVRRRTTSAPQLDTRSGSREAPSTCREHAPRH